MRVYYLAGTTGWGSSFVGLRAFLWDPLSQAVYTTTNAIITIIGYTGPGGDVTIPDMIDNLPVISIGTYAIGDSGLTSLTIPSSITNIEIGAFSGCVNLTAITMDPLNSVYSSLDGVLFDKSQTTLIFCPAAKGGSFIIPNSVINIEDSAFSGCSSLTSVTIPNSATNIGNAAFSQCISLTNVTIGNSVITIGDYAFQETSLMECRTISRLRSKKARPACALGQRSSGAEPET